MSVYGPIIDGNDIEGWVVEHLQTWLPGYINEVARQRRVTAPPAIRSWTTVNDFDRWPELQLPTGVVVSPGLATEQRPVQSGEGKYRATWALGIAVVVGAKDKPSTQKLAKMYAAAVRSAIAQHPSLGQSAVRSAEWRNESYRDIPNDDSRTLGAGLVYFNIEVDGVVNTKAGLLAPPADPGESPDDWPVVGDIIITINKEELD